MLCFFPPMAADPPPPLPVLRLAVGLKLLFCTLSTGPRLKPLSKKNKRKTKKGKRKGGENKNSSTTLGQLN